MHVDMGRNSGSVANTKKVSEVTVKDIYIEVSYLNPRVSTVSSLGSFVRNDSKLTSDYLRDEIEQYLPDGSLAYKIMTSRPKNFSEKQLWVIAYELKKNKKYTRKLGLENQKIKERKLAKKERRRNKLERNRKIYERLFPQEALKQKPK